MYKDGKSRIGQAQSNESWMLTFADLLSLLLTFFVLIFSMSTIEYDSWGDVVETMREEFNAARSTVTPKRFDTEESVARVGLRGLNLNYLRVIVERSIANNAALKGVTVTRENDRVIVSLPASGLFDDKETRFLDGAVSSLEQLAGSFVQIKNRLTIAAHTNNLPVASNRFRSNWELSISRAQLVAGVFADAGYQEPITVLGHGDSKFETNPVGRATIEQMNQQERVDFIILSEGRERGPFDVF